MWSGRQVLDVEREASIRCGSGRQVLDVGVGGKY